MKRVVTAAILIPLVSCVILLGHPWLFMAVTAVVALFCFREYGGLVAGHGIDRPGPVAYGAGLVLLTVPRSDLLLVILVVLLVLTLALRFAEPAKALPGAAAAVLGILYVFGAWRSAVSLRTLPEAGPYWLLFVLALNWIGDTAAFYVGRPFGRHKMAPRLSPGKSWEGSAASIAVSLVFGFFYLGWLIPAVPPVERFLIAALGNVAGQSGDLVESLMKRGARVKDSGSSLPGHGGWLDRVDSALFSLPVVYGLVILLGRG